MSKNVSKTQKKGKNLIMVALFLCLIFINFGVILYMIFMQNKRTFRVIVWALTLFVLPFVGIILFILFGCGIFYRRKKLSEILKETYLNKLNLKSNFNQLNKDLLNINFKLIQNYLKDKQNINQKNLTEEQNIIDQIKFKTNEKNLNKQQNILNQNEFKMNKNNLNQEQNINQNHLKYKTIIKFNQTNLQENRKVILKNEKIAEEVNTIKNNILENALNKNCNFFEKNMIKTMIFNTNLHKTNVIDNENVEIFRNGKDAFKSIFYEIEKAKISIFMSFYIFADDEIGTKLLNLLTKKVKQKVKVVVTIDTVGSKKTSKKFFKNFENLGGIVVWFNPSKCFGNLFLNYRNHRKILVIDHSISFIGGLNVRDDHLSKNKKLSPWLDTHLKIVGNTSFELLKTFLLDLKLSANKKNLNKLNMIFNNEFFENLEKNMLNKRAKNISKFNEKQAIFYKKNITNNIKNYEICKYFDVKKSEKFNVYLNKNVLKFCIKNTKKMAKISKKNGFFYKKNGKKLNNFKCFYADSKSQNLTKNIKNNKIKIQVLNSSKLFLSQKIEESLINLINFAQSEIVIESPYFVPDDKFLCALKNAIIRGVSVKILISKKPDKMFVYNASLYYLNQLLQIGAEVFLFNGFVHSKTLLVDREIFVCGSSNFDMRSFNLNFETSVCVYDKLIAQKFYKEIEKNLCYCEKLDINFYKKLKFSKKLALKFAKLFSPVL